MIDEILQIGDKIVLPEKFKQKYDDFSKSVRGNDILDPKTTLLIYIASSLAVGCYH